MKFLIPIFLLFWSFPAHSSVDKTIMERVWKKTEMTQPFKKAPEFVKDELVCLALNVYHEARGSTLLDKVSTAFVVLNRLSNQYRGATSVCDVVWARKQFSWTHDGKSDMPRNQKAWRESQLIALMVYRAEDLGLQDPTEGSTHYVRYDIFEKIGWTRNVTRSVQIGSHIYMHK